MRNFNQAAATTAAVYTGTVLWFREEKGFGFIRLGHLPAVCPYCLSRIATGDTQCSCGYDASADVFVHHSGINGVPGRRNLQQGQVVEFEISKGPKGPIATNVRVTKPEEARP